MNYYFVALLLLCTVYALVAGGSPERVAAILYLLSCAASYLSWTKAGTWHEVELGVFLVDVVTFALFCLLALRADRFWPIWVSALLGLGVLGHLARVAEPGLFWWAYAVALTIWSYPILALIAFGTWAHRRRLARFGADPSWSRAAADPTSSHWYTKYRPLPRPRNRPQLRID